MAYKDSDYTVVLTVVC